jgi:hypothetical protein
MCLYALKFDMVILETCLDGMGAFQDSRMYDVPNAWIDPWSCTLVYKTLDVL